MIKTDIDELITLLNDKHTVKTSYASIHLGIEVDHLHRWIAMLEKEEVISIHYHLFGDSTIKRGQRFHKHV